jgi:CRP-like cAMP-binding protein
MTSEQLFIKRLLDAADAKGISKIFSKGEYLIKEGQVEQSIRFGYEGSIITSLSSFITGKASEFYIEALRKSTVKIIQKQLLFEIVNESTETLRQYNKLLEGLIIQQMEREIDLLTESPAKRLQRVLARSPNLFQEIPLKYIASYLRMTPETLSRIRNS